MIIYNFSIPSHFLILLIDHYCTEPTILKNDNIILNLNFKSLCFVLFQGVSGVIWVILVPPPAAFPAARSPGVSP